MKIGFSKEVFKMKILHLLQFLKIAKKPDFLNMTLNKNESFLI